MNSSSLLCVLHALSIAPYLTWLFQLYLARSTNYGIPYYTVFSSLLLFHPSEVQICSSAPCSHITSLYVL
jgi:hypothetical protein